MWRPLIAERGLALHLGDGVAGVAGLPVRFALCLLGDGYDASGLTSALEQLGEPARGIRRDRDR
jgi:hypothetical protein